MMLVMRAGRISARVLGVFDTIVFHTCSAADRTVYATSLRAMYRLATTCRTEPADQFKGFRVDVEKSLDEDQHISWLSVAMILPHFCAPSQAPQ